MSLSGVFGALSAAEGFKGGHGILDGDEGFWVMAGSDRCDFDVMTKDLGITHYIEDTMYKVHPSIAWNHPPFVALQALQVEHGFSADDIDQIIIKGLGAARIADYAPSGEVDAMFSLPYTVALTVLGDPLLPAMYSDERRQSESVQALLKRIRIEESNEADLAWFNEHRMCDEVTVILKNGRKLYRDVEFPRDKPEIGWAQLEQKFRDLAQPYLSSARIDNALAVVDKLEDCSDIAQLVSLLHVA